MVDDVSPYSRSSNIVIEEKRGSVHGVFGFLTVIFLAALIRGHLGAETSNGRLAVDFFAGMLFIGTVALWIYMRRHPGRIGVSRDEVQQWARGQRRSAVITRADGDLYIKYSGPYKHPQPYLRATGADQGLLLTMYDQKEVVDACIACGWTFTQP